MQLVWGCLVEGVWRRSESAGKSRQSVGGESPPHGKGESGDTFENSTNGAVGVWGWAIFRSSETSILKGVVSGDGNMMFTR